MLTSRSRSDDLEAVVFPPIPISILWPDAQKGPWHVTVWWREQHGVAVAVGIEMRSWVGDEDEPLMRDALGRVLPQSDAEVEFPTIDSQFMKRLPVGRLLAQSRATAAWSVENARIEVPPGVPADTEFDRMVAEIQHNTGYLRRPARSGRDLGDEHYADVAGVYTAAARAGEPPTVAVAERFTISKSAAAKQVARARERGFLPKTTRGRVGKLSEEL